MPEHAECDGSAPAASRREGTIQHLVTSTSIDAVIAMIAAIFVGILCWYRPDTNFALSAGSNEHTTASGSRAASTRPTVNPDCQQSAEVACHT